LEVEKIASEQQELGQTAAGLGMSKGFVFDQGEVEDMVVGQKMVGYVTVYHMEHYVDEN
jgi:hypothetical protein